MNIQMESSWKTLLQEEFTKPYFKNLVSFLKEQYKTRKIYPQGPNIFKAFELTPVKDVKVVLLGQDPYHGTGQAMGLSFSVPEGIKTPPSLQNIYKEIYSDIGKEPPKTGDLTHWAKQGVLLLNSILTVEDHNAGSHQKKGWEEFTDAVIKQLNDKHKNIVFMLWGNYAKKKGEIIDEEKHYVLTAPHPSPFSVHSGFFGCKHFSKCNKFLILNDKEPIEW